jgi:hypothetical protein
MITNLGRSYYKKFAAAATINGKAIIKFIKTPKIDIYILKGGGPLKQKNVYWNNGKS